jgi:hypothetical protein
MNKKIKKDMLVNQSWFSFKENSNKTINQPISHNLITK